MIIENAYFLKKIVDYSKRSRANMTAIPKINQMIEEKI